eukprot:CAMPEP_0201565520 /NCGR_PEP_ID=MMETSP0190_2-20130828/4670_1 /ASSEMBLY_ACC=CAM_ASM_000263 /TAXON_ID=37353 /ORGANISM="Rosalina sp." /LENGTH=395 /DNA_ID=CAMNT_0047983117 /DNA_START=14 /DNA_END=1198 /DNA_ORIENTATION=-
MASDKPRRQADMRDYLKGAKASNKASGKKGGGKGGKGKGKNTKQTNKITPEIADELLTKISIHRGSITDLRVDAVVNAANGGLWAGAGVCGAIFRAAGYSGLQRECDAITDKFGQIPTGESVLTKGYKLHAKYIIHSVGPTSQNNQALVSAYKTALDLCILNDIRSIAFPCISTGIFGFSKRVAAPLVLRTIRHFLLSAKEIKYKDYVKLLKQKQKLQIQEALKRKKRSKYRYGSSYMDDDSDDDQDEDADAAEWAEDDGDDDKGKNKKGAKKGKGEDDDEDVDMNKKTAKGDKDNDNTEKKNDSNDDKKVFKVSKQNENEDESKGADNDGNNDNDNDKEQKAKENENDDEYEETVFDRIDDIVFCCYDIGNWHLYEDNTPDIFPSTNDQHSYLW